MSLGPLDYHRASLAMSSNVDWLAEAVEETSYCEDRKYLVLAIAPLLYDQNLKPETTRQRTEAPLEGSTIMENMQMLKFWAPVFFKILKFVPLRPGSFLVQNPSKFASSFLNYEVFARF